MKILPFKGWKSGAAYLGLSVYSWHFVRLYNMLVEMTL